GAAARAVRHLRRRLRRPGLGGGPMTVMAEGAIATADNAEMTTAAALNSALDLALAADPKVLLLGEDIADPSGGVFKVTKGLSTRHGIHRVRDTPIDEPSILGAAIGAAMADTRMVTGWLYSA